MALSFEVGDTFSSYKDFKDRVEDFEKINFVQFTHRDSRTLAAAAKRAPKVVEKANKELVYYSIVLTCVLGGKRHKCEGSGVRPNQKTIKQGCPASLKLCLTEDCQKLTVSHVNMNHNHDVSKEIYCHLPRQRKLNSGEKDEAKLLLGMKANKKLLQRHLNSTGKVVTLKDISNVQRELNASSSGNDLDGIVNRLRQLEGSAVDVFVDESKVFTGLFFQDAKMKYNFNCFPEIIFFDATYKLNELRMPLYLMLVIDSNGQSEIVSVFLTSIETKEAITNMIKVFKSVNPSWCKVGVVVTDKDFTERAVFEEQFPGVRLQICLFHALRSFRREVTADKLGIRPGERDYSLEIITNLAYSRSEEEYEKHYAALLETAPKSVVNYYNANWHAIKHEWVECFKSTCVNFGERTNNRLESINSKVKSVCSKFASLSRFFDEFFSVLSVLRNERDHSTVMAMVKKPVIFESDQDEFANLVTPYAHHFILKQQTLRKKVKILNQENDLFTVSSSEGTLSVTSSSCQCAFASTMQLPCRHIFAVRDLLKSPLYSEVGVANRWKLSFLKETFKNKSTTVQDCSYEVSYRDTVEHSGRSTLTQHQKFQKAKAIVDKLPSLASEVGMDEFMRRMDTLKQVHDVWAHGGNVIVFDEDDENIQQLRTTQVSSTVDTCDGDLVPPISSEVTIDGGEVYHHHDEGENNDGKHDEGENNDATDNDNIDIPVSLVDNHKDFQDVTLPPKLKKRGRPKGAEKTVIGIPRKKKRLDKPLPFLKKLPLNRERVILQWFVEPSDAEIVLARKGLIQEDGVEIIPERITASCLDDQVHLDSCKKYFTKDGWLAVQNVVEAIKKNPAYYCGSCTLPINDEEEESIQCDSCLIWYHFKCVHLKQRPKSAAWFCRSCYDNIPA